MVGSHSQSATSLRLAGCGDVAGDVAGDVYGHPDNDAGPQAPVADVRATPLAPARQTCA
jgi:hypothetical protein